jgi:hypothetical protein
MTLGSCRVVASMATSKPIGNTVAPSPTIATAPASNRQAEVITHVPYSSVVTAHHAAKITRATATF